MKKWSDYKVYVMTLALVGVLGLNVNWEQEPQTLSEGFSEIASTQSEHTYHVKRVVKSDKKGGIYQAVVKRTVGKSTDTYFLDVKRIESDKTQISISEYDPDNEPGETQSDDCNDCILQNAKTDINFGTGQKSLQEILSYLEKEGVFPGEVITFQTGDVEKVVEHVTEKSSLCDKKEKKIDKFKCHAKECLALAKKVNREEDGYDDDGKVIACYQDNMKEFLTDRWKRLKKRNLKSEKLTDFQELLQEHLENFAETEIDSAIEVAGEISKILAKTYHAPQEKVLAKILDQKDYMVRENQLRRYNQFFLQGAKPLKLSLGELNNVEMQNDVFNAHYFCPIAERIPSDSFLRTAMMSPFNQGHVSGVCSGGVGKGPQSVVGDQTADADLLIDFIGRSSLGQTSTWGTPNVGGMKINGQNYGTLSPLNTPSGGTGTGRTSRGNFNN